MRRIIALWSITLWGLFGGVGVSAQQVSSPPIGRLYTVHERSMHLYCTGSGSPTVILEGGVGGFSLTWSPVQDELSRLTRVCSYDRAGYGWSAPNGDAFDMTAAVDDLHTLLDAANIPPPYLFVAHSFGGVTARAYHATYPDAVVGMVLLDAVHPDMPERIAGYPDALSRQLDGLRMMSGFARMTFVQEDANAPIPSEVAPSVNDLYMEKILEPQFFATSEAEALYLAYAMPSLDLPNTLGDMPLVVLSHGIAERRSFLGAPMSRAQATQAESTWQLLQRELAKLSSNSQHIIATDSGHSIQADAPQLVVRAVADVLAQVR